MTGTNPLKADKACWEKISKFDQFFEKFSKENGCPGFVTNTDTFNWTEKQFIKAMQEFDDYLQSLDPGLKGIHITDFKELYDGLWTLFT